VALDKTYPNPIVDHATARRNALQSYETIRRRESDEVSDS